MSDQSLEPAGSDYGLVSHIASRTTPLHSVALRVMNILSNRLLLKPIIPIDNPHRGSGDFHEKAVKWNICCTWFFYSEWAALARQERIALPSELAVASGSRLDPMSLQQEECDHLVIGLALRRLRRRTVITPRSASIPVLLLKAFLFSGSSRRQHQSRRGGHARLVVRAVFPEAQ